MPTVKLTQDLLSTGLHCPPPKRRIELCDTELPGLYIEVRAPSPGEGTYYLRYKDTTGKTCHQKIGRTTDTNLTDARKKGRTLKAEIELGADPRRQVKAAKAVITLDRFFNEHYLPYAKPRKRSWKRDEELYRLRISEKLGSKRLNEITRLQVQTLQAEVRASGLSPATADHHVKLIRQALNRAVEWEMLEKNPAAGVKLFNVDNKVENYLEDEKLKRLTTVLQTHPNRAVCRIAMFLLSTGCRLNEALKATWDQIDSDQRVWKIPASNSKSKRIRSVPLNDVALEVLAELDTKGTFDHLFINKQTGKPYRTIMKVWSRIRNRAGVPYMRIHDLRHQFASFLVNSGRTLFEVQQILGHSDPSVTQRYAHLSSRSLQAAANSASIAIGNARSSGTVAPATQHAQQI